MGSDVENELSDMPHEVGPSSEFQSTRRLSTSSISSRHQVNKDMPALILDQIHSSASQTSSLTTFNDIAPPSSPISSNHERQFSGGGVGGLYGRLKSSKVNNKTAPDAVLPAKESGISKSIAAQSLQSEGKLVKSPVPTTDASINFKEENDAPNPPTFPNISESSNTKPSFAQVSERNASVYPQVTTSRTDKMEDTFKSLADPETPVSEIALSETQNKHAVDVNNRQRHHSSSSTATVSDIRRQPLRKMPRTADQQSQTRLEVKTSNLTTTENGYSGANELTRPKSEIDHVHNYGETYVSMDRPNKSLNAVNLSKIQSPKTPTLQRRISIPDSIASSHAGGQSGYHDVFGGAGTSSRHGNHWGPRKRQLISKEFWMKDENAKVCYLCGDGFSTFRRKHHCRMCGQIYDAKCTTLVTGDLFGQVGTVRVCKTCQRIATTSHDSSEDSDDADIFPQSQAKYLRTPGGIADDAHSGVSTPAMRNSLAMAPEVDIADSARSIVAGGSRLREGRKRSIAIIEPDLYSSLTRPSSSRSLKSMLARPRSSSRRHHSSHLQHMKSLRMGHDDSAPFRRDAFGSSLQSESLPAFHTDSIVDPDLAQFMSDEDTSEEESASIDANVGSFAQDTNAAGLGNMLNALRRAKSHTNSKPLPSNFSRDPDSMSISSTRISRSRRPQRTRTMSLGSVAPYTSSPRIVRSDNMNSAIRTQVDPWSDPSPLVHATDTPQERQNAANYIENTKYKPCGELNAASLKHIKYLLRQSLYDANIGHIHRWEKVLSTIIIQCAINLDLNLQRNDSIDIRQYIKLKKAAGGKPSDSVYVAGVVFTGNIALKRMPRIIKDARILLISFPIVYTRQQQHFMSLEPIIAQEREYLRKLVNRMLALQPDVVLVHQSISGLALQFLQDAGISVICNVKESVMHAIARCSRTRIISSVDKLSMDPNLLGYCSRFEIKALMYCGLKKSYVYISGCQLDLGCTIVLRGADTDTLRIVKVITEFMCFVTYNLKLETSLMRDAFVGILPTDDQEYPHQRQSSLTYMARRPKAPVMPDPSEYKSQNSDPQITHVDEKKTSDKSSRENNNDAPQSYADLLRELKLRILSISPSVHFEAPYLLQKGHEQEVQILQLKTLQSRVDLEKDETNEGSHPPQFELVRPEMVYDITQSGSRQVREVIRAIHDAEFERTIHRYDTLKRRWEIFLASSFEPFSPFSHQKIIVLFSVVSFPTLIACAGPDLLAMEFYQEHSQLARVEPDVPLGEYVESLLLQAQTPCITGRCDRKMLHHRRRYVHGEGEVVVSTQEQSSKIQGMEDTILMWSRCKICGEETPVTPMSSDTWKYSFAKYLELSFWSRMLSPRAGICLHDVHRDYDRFFGFKALILQIHYEPINLMEVIVPRATITWKVAKDLQLKNAQYKKIEERITRFMASVTDRINGINIQNIELEKADACKQEVARLLHKSNDDLTFLLNKLQEKYMMSKFYENIPMNRVVRAMQEKVAEWDTAFYKFDHDYLPSDKDLRAMVTQQLKKMYLNREEGASLGEAQISTETPGEIEEKPGSDHRENTDALSQHSVDNTQPVYSVENHLSDTVTTNWDGTVHVSDTKLPSSQNVLQHLDLTSSVHVADPTGLSEELNPPTLPQRSVAEQRSAENDTFISSEPDGMNSEGEDRDSKSRGNRHHRSIGAPPPLLRSQTTPDRMVRQSINKSIQHSLGLNMTPLKSDQVENSLQLRDREITKRSETSPLRKSKTPRQSLIPRAIPNKKLESKVSALAKHFEMLSREFERERLRQRRQKFTRNRLLAFPAASSQPVVEIYRDAQEAVHGRNASEEDFPQVEPPGSIPALNDAGPARTLDDVTEFVANAEDENARERADPPRADESIPETYTLSDVEGGLSETETFTSDARVQDDEEEDQHSLAPDSSVDLALELPKHERGTLMKMLTSFWSERTASGWSTLDYPLIASDHVFADSDVIVREDEPSSLIAFSLASHDYTLKMQNFRDRVRGPEKREASGQIRALDFEDPEVEGILLGETATHLKYQFQDGPAIMHCKVFYSESFDAIRRKCGVADRFVESLSRCLKWDSKGGKTKSLFLKTLDERFVLKSLSHVEVQAFLKFAPDYFHYMSETLFHSLPSAIAKILGFYQVVIKNPATGSQFTHFLQVMENVFYEGQSNRMFDLKGSMRNRRIESTGQENEVLLDENFLDYLSQSPVYVRNHANAVLAQSIQNDTLFCSKQNVMDYSLVVGLYDDRKELVVGVIDYIRTYTWDKKLENMIKDRGKHRATVREPRKYRARFRESIARYFPLAPSCWHILPSQYTERSTLRAAIAESEPEGGGDRDADSIEERQKL